MFHSPQHRSWILKVTRENIYTILFIDFGLVAY